LEWTEPVPMRCSAWRSKVVVLDRGRKLFHSVVRGFTLLGCDMRVSANAGGE
jgi:hypothetical protein